MAVVGDPRRRTGDPAQARTRAVIAQPPGRPAPGGQMKTGQDFLPSAGNCSRLEKLSRTARRRKSSGADANPPLLRASAVRARQASRPRRMAIDRPTSTAGLGIEQALDLRPWTRTDDQRAASSGRWSAPICGPACLPPLSFFVSMSALPPSDRNRSRNESGLDYCGAASGKEEEIHCQRGPVLDVGP